MVHPAAVSRPGVIALSALAWLGCQAPHDARLAAGDEAARAGRWDAARLAWAEAASLDPRSAAALGRLGTAWWALERPDEARRAWSAALALAPAHPEASLGLARLALARGAPTEALEALTPLRAGEPRLAEQKLRAQALLARGQAGDAEAALETARAAAGLAPQDPETRYLEGSAHLALRQLALASAAFEAAQRAAPTSALGPYGLARTAAARGDGPEALRHLAAARQAAAAAWAAERVASDPAFAFVADAPGFLALQGK